MESKFFLQGSLAFEGHDSLEDVKCFASLAEAKDDKWPKFDYDKIFRWDSEREIFLLVSSYNDGRWYDEKEIK